MTGASKTRKRRRKRTVRKVKPGEKAIVTYRPKREHLLRVPGWAEVEIVKEQRDSD